MRCSQWTKLALCAAVLAGLSAICLPARGGGLEDCIAATCRVRAEDGSTGSGFLYAVGPEEPGGEDLAWIGTAAHVVVGDRLICEFGRARIRVEVHPFWRNRQIDAGVLVVPWRVPQATTAADSRCAAPDPHQGGAIDVFDRVPQRWWPDALAGCLQRL